MKNLFQNLLCQPLIYTHKKFHYLAFLFFLFSGSFHLVQGATFTVSPVTITNTVTTSNPVIVGNSNLNFDSSPWSEWSIRIYTNNTGGTPGLKGVTDPSKVLPLKVWCSNYGPGASAPNPQVETNWNNYWLRVPDYAEMNPSSSATWRTLLSGTAVYSLTNYPIYFAVDASKGAYSGQTYSGVVKVDIINSISSEVNAQKIVQTLTFNITVNIPLQVSIQLDNSQFGSFTNVSTTATRVQASGKMMVSLSAQGLRNINTTLDYNAATLRVYTSNNPSQPQVIQFGMKGQTNSSQNIPVKIWTPNYGAGIDSNSDGIPDITNDQNWKSAGAVWAYMLDANKPVRENYYSPAEDPLGAWNKPLFDLSDLFKWSDLHHATVVIDGTTEYKYHLPTAIKMNHDLAENPDRRIPVFFSLVLDKKAGPQIYSTQVIVEFALSKNNGNTFTTYSQAFTLTVNLLNATPQVTLTANTQNFNNFTFTEAWPAKKVANGRIVLDFRAYGIYNYNAISLRAYTNNSPGNVSIKRNGLVGSMDAKKTVPLRIWTPNFGLGIDANADGIPDVDNFTNWRDNNLAVWSPIMDKNDPVRENYYTITEDSLQAWNHSLFDYCDLFKWSDFHNRTDAYGDFVYKIPGYLELMDRTSFQGGNFTVPVYIAGDFTDAYPQNYQTTIYFEAALSADSGNTIAQTVVIPVTVSANVNTAHTALEWLQQRVDMRPDLDNTNSTIEKLADSHQEAMDWSDGGWLYDQALAIMALTKGNKPDYAQQLLNGLKYMQNSDGSWFFSYLTIADKSMVDTWKNTDVKTYSLQTNGTVLITNQANGIPDEAEKRAFSDKIHGNFDDQLGDWYMTDYSTTICPQTQTTLPDKIKYRTYDFRKYTGSIAWAALSIIYYDLMTNDTSYRSVLRSSINWLNQQIETNSTKPGYGGIKMGRTWFFWNPDGAINGWIDMPSFPAEHNLDAYAVYKLFADLTGSTDSRNKAAAIKNFMVTKLWAPHVNTSVYPEVIGEVNNNFFAGLDMYTNTTHGLIDTSYYLDAQSWSILSLGGNTAVLDKNGASATIACALDFLTAIDPNNGTTVWTDYHGAPIYNKAFLKVAQKTFMSGTGYQVTGIDGFKELARDKYYQTAENPIGDFVWSEGSEGVVAAYHATGRTTDATYYHNETRSYQMVNGGVPYSTLTVPDSAAYVWSQRNWSFSANNSVAGTAWFLFNDLTPVLNPYQPYPADNSLCFANFNQSTGNPGTGSDKTDEGGKSSTYAGYVNAQNTGKMVKWEWTLNGTTLGYSYVYTYIFKDPGATKVTVNTTGYKFLKFWIKVQGAAVNRILKVNVAYNSSRTSYYTPALKSGWNEIEIPINATSAVTNVDFVFEGGNTIVGPATVYIDDIKFTKLHQLDGGSCPPDGDVVANGIATHTQDANYLLSVNDPKNETFDVQIFPNPFLDLFTIKLTSSTVQKIKIEIFNQFGQRIELICDTEIPDGVHSWQWESDNNVPGFYFVRIDNNDYTKIYKLMQIK